ncbi:beta-lactamase family protein, partial [Vibrio parahaemolyticus V-223/04]
GKTTTSRFTSVFTSQTQTFRFKLAIN